MSVDQNHELVLTKHAAGVAEWTCPACGRHLRVTRPGRLEILVRGDQTVNHGAGVAGPIRFTGRLSVEAQEHVEPWRSEPHSDDEPWRSVG